MRERAGHASRAADAGHLESVDMQMFPRTSSGRLGACVRKGRLAIVIGRSLRRGMDVAGAPPRLAGDATSGGCCAEMAAACLACQANMDVAEFCEHSPWTDGCPAAVDSGASIPKPHAEAALVDDAVEEAAIEKAEPPPPPPPRSLAAVSANATANDTNATAPGAGECPWGYVVVDGSLDALGPCAGAAPSSVAHPRCASGKYLPSTRLSALVCSDFVP